MKETTDRQIAESSHGEKKVKELPSW